ncbi:hypothetical protein M407DRAFT_33776 [Tulasnella calospora MUT 4182]|uniref:Uncharacterized protein n=1 Tax=Tulasnella calospora MUT 4182 TaxID=1051891 RepID=A0A0C3PPY5_9AGAM|nr:hypothetical protein M407DRAFT_33776 [Tulasnella calospora MUT 4182]
MSFDTKTTLTTIVDMLAAFVALNNIQPDDQNDLLIQTMSVAGSMSRADVATQFRQEQTRRDTLNTAKETSLAANVGRTPRRNPKAGEIPCEHCKRTNHKSENCYTKHPDKKPQWMKDRDEEQRKRRAQQQQQQPPKPTVAAHVADDNESSSEESDTEEPAKSDAEESANVASLTSSSTSPHSSMANDNWIMLNAAIRRL